MPLKKVQECSNMYQGWVTHTHTHLGGFCPHACSYCYVDNPRFGRPDRYQGELRLIEKELDVRYGKGKTIFIDNCNDLFAVAVKDEWIESVLAHYCKYPDNVYVFQTKNPERIKNYLNLLPSFCILLTTIETNRENNLSYAPTRYNRSLAMSNLSGYVQNL